MKDYRIKHYTPDNTPIAEITSLNEKHFGLSAAWTDFETTNWFVAYEGGAPWVNPIAFAGVQFSLDPHGLIDEAFLCRCAVNKNWRGHGLQRHLIRKRVNLCLNLGVENIYTYTTVSSVHSMRNLISNKFRPCLLPESWVGTDMDAGDDVVYWKKEYKV
jgi:GNAT superfamily N-acetyltransferase